MEFSQTNCRINMCSKTSLENSQNKRNSYFYWFLLLSSLYLPVLLIRKFFALSPFYFFSHLLFSRDCSELYILNRNIILSNSNVTQLGIPINFEIVLSRNQLNFNFWLVWNFPDACEIRRKNNHIKFFIMTLFHTIHGYRGSTV